MRLLDGIVRFPSSLKRCFADWADATVVGLVDVVRADRQTSMLGSLLRCVVGERERKGSLKNH